MILALLIALTAAEPSDDSRSVVVMLAAEPGALPVDAGKIAEAIALRLSTTSVEVLTAPRAGEPAWVAAVHPTAAGIVDVGITSPSGRLVRSGELEARGRQPSDLAETIALWVIEALTPVMPELARELPKEAAPLEVVSEPPPPPTREPSTSFDLRVGIGAQRLMVTNRNLGILAVEGEIGLTPHLAVVLGVDVSTRLQESDTTFEVQARRLGATAALAWRWRQGPLAPFAHVGPMLRASMLSASGERITFANRTEVDVGAQVTIGAVTRAWPVDVGVSVRGERYFARPDVHLDGVSVLDLGSTAIACNVWLQRRF